MRPVRTDSPIPSRNETMRSTIAYGISAVYYACIAHRHNARCDREVVKDVSRMRLATILNDDL